MYSHGYSSVCSVLISRVEMYRPTPNHTGMHAMTVLIVEFLLWTHAIEYI